MKVECIYWPGERERYLLKRFVWVTMGKTEEPKELPSPKLVRDLLNARHTPIRVLNFAFLIEDIPSNIATHLARHVHAVPGVSSLRNDRHIVSAARRAAEAASAAHKRPEGADAASAAKQDAAEAHDAKRGGATWQDAAETRDPQSVARARGEVIDGDEAPRNTPVSMIFYCNAEELMTVANKRLCRMASEKTRTAVGMMCLRAVEKMPELEGLLVPMCDWHGGVCHEINGCGRRPKG